METESTNGKRLMQNDSARRQQKQQQLGCTMLIYTSTVATYEAQKIINLNGLAKMPSLLK